MPSRVLNFKTPLQALAHHVEFHSILMLPPQIFGCVVYVHLHKNQRTKLDPCVVRYIFLGYAHIRRVTDAMILLLGDFMLPWMLLFLKPNIFFQAPSSNSSL